MQYFAAKSGACWPLDAKQQKEQYSNAFIHAAAAVAGFATAKPSVDDDSIDWTLSQRGGTGAIRSPKLDVQLKCTEIATLLETDVRYRLDLKNYDELRPTNVQTPRILVVVLVPEDMGTWFLMDETTLALRSCAYWYSLRGMPPTANLDNITLHIPRVQRFDAIALSQMMARIGQGNPP